MRKHTISFQNAINGIVWSLKTQPNFRIHFILSFIAILLSYFLQVSYFEFLTILILIFVGLIVESVNTAIEVTTDAIDNEWREDLKIAKDVAASAMLIFSIGSLFIASIIFIPKMAKFILLI